MLPVKFSHATHQLNKPVGMEDCGPLWVYGDLYRRSTTSCWRLSWRERLSALLFGRCWLEVVMGGKTQPPVAIEIRRKRFATITEYCKCKCTARWNPDVPPYYTIREHACGHVFNGANETCSRCLLSREEHDGALKELVYKHPEMCYSCGALCVNIARLGGFEWQLQPFLATEKGPLCFACIGKEE